jgi:hypothetical protein
VDVFPDADEILGLVEQLVDRLLLLVRHRPALRVGRVHDRGRGRDEFPSMHSDHLPVSRVPGVF